MSPGGISARIVAHTVRTAGRFAWTTLALGVAMTSLGLYYAANHLGINTDTADMISPALPWRKDFSNYRDSFPARDRNLVVVIESPNGEISQALAGDLAAALAEDPTLFPIVFYRGGDFFERNGLLYLPLSELEELADRLIDAQPLLGRLSSDVSGAGIVHVIGESLTLGSEIEQAVVNGLDPILLEMAATLAASASAERRSIAWGQLIGPETQPAARQLVMVRPALDFSRLRPAREAIERLHEIGARLRAEYGDAVSLRLTGTLAMEHEELTSISRSATVAGLLALAMVIIVLMWALRSPVLLLIAVLVLLVGLSLTAAFAAVTVGRLNLLSVAFAVLYVGLGVDFILHLLLRLKELRNSGVDLDQALVETGAGVGSSLVICAVTTAAGFFAFMPTDFDGVSELGLISGGGMFISLGVSLTLLPALLKVLWRRPPGPVPGRPGGRLTRAGFRPHPRATLTIAALVLVGALALLPQLEFDGNPIHLRDPDAESIRALNDLAADSEAPLFNLAVMVPDSAAADRVAAELTALPTVKAVQTAASLVPDDQDEKLFVIEDLDLVMGSTLSRFEARASGPERIAVELESLVNVLRDRPAMTRPQDALATTTSAWLARWRSLDAVGATALAAALDADILGTLVDQVARLNRGLGAEPLDRDDLPSELLDRWVNRAGRELVEVVPEEDLNDNEAAARFIRDVRTIAPNATGLPVVYQEAAATVTRAFTIALAYAFGIVSLLLLLFLRSLRDAVLVLIPIGFAAVLTAGASSLLGLPLNFANIIALPLLIGVGVDSGIHMVHRMRTEPPADGNPLHTSTSRAVFMSALTTIASFGNLAFSTHYGMASMGHLLTLGMIMSLIAVLGVLPALIRMVSRT